MEFCSTYIETNKFDEVVEFYEKLTQKKETVYTKNRWVEFKLGNKLSVYNRKFDESLIDSGDTEGRLDENYKNNFLSDKEIRRNNSIVLNFFTPNLTEEHDRIKKLRIGRVSEIMFVNFTAPYFFFNVYDPDGNTIEIYSGTK